MCDPAPLLKVLDAVGLSVCQLLYWVLNAILFVQVSSADVRQVSRLVEDCSDFGCVPSAQFGGCAGGESDVNEARGHCSPNCRNPYMQARLWPRGASIVDVLPDFLQFDVPLL